MVTLLLKNRSPLNPADNEGFTPLHHAIAEGHGKKTLFATGVKKPLTSVLQETLLLLSSKKALISP